MGKDKNRGYKEDTHYNAAQYEWERQVILVVLTEKFVLKWSQCDVSTHVGQQEGVPSLTQPPPPQHSPPDHLRSKETGSYDR